jgi:hypothetical protein
MEHNEKDLEAGGGHKEAIRHWTMIRDQGVLTPRIIQHEYQGSGTEDDPFVIVWIPDDPRNPLLFPYWYKWAATTAMAFGILAVSLCSSAFTGGIPTLMEDFNSSEEVTVLGLSLFVLGFAVGPLFWAPLRFVLRSRVCSRTDIGQ